MAVPLDLADEELQTAAMACRAYAYREAERAKAMENTDMQRLIEGTAERFARLAERFRGGAR
jgi:hypothetical protein